jgi:hypothetical protein
MAPPCRSLCSSSPCSGMAPCRRTRPRICAWQRSIRPGWGRYAFPIIASCRPARPRKIGAANRRPSPLQTMAAISCRHPGRLRPLSRPAGLPVRTSFDPRRDPCPWIGFVPADPRPRLPRRPRRGPARDGLSRRASTPDTPFKPARSRLIQQNAFSGPLSVLRRHGRGLTVGACAKQPTPGNCRFDWNQGASRGRLATLKSARSSHVA